MQNAQANIFATPIVIKRNTTKASRHQWAKIMDKKTGKTLHIGQISYIRRVAREKYNVSVKM